MNPRRTWMVLLAFAALLAAAPNASAKPGYIVFPGYRSPELDLKGTNGYLISIRREGDYVEASISRGSTAAFYTTRSLESKGDGIKARFPGVGRVSVRFRPQGPPREIAPNPFPGCRGGKIVKQPGHFVGTIRLRGERGYTSAQASRARATIETRAKVVCKRSSFQEDDDQEERTELWAHWIAGSRAVGFDALVLGEPFDLTSFGVQVRERRRGMTISRLTLVTGEKSDVVVGDTRPRPLSATIAPPAPFSGSATYERLPDGSRTWTGSLAITLPGIDPVPLAGPRFEALLCQRSGCTGNTIDGHRLPWTAPGLFPLSPRD